MTESHSQKHLESPEFQSLLIDCLEKLERGESLDRDALVDQHPEYTEAIDELLSNQQMLRTMAKNVRDSFDGADGSVVLESNIDVTVGSVPIINDFSDGKKIRYIGEYGILGEIARGGMGVVFKARQQSLNRIVALKMILSGRLADAADVDRFRREAQAAGRLKHPNIVPVHEVGEFEGRHYFTMDFVDGGSLADEIRTETLAPRRAAEILKTVAEAVYFANQQGTVHRDLKPANILLTDGIVPHVTDFGLAKVIDGVEGDSQNELTASGQILGTPSYMSPEQAEGKQNLVGPASDIYSLGAILYATLTGRAPFVADSPVDTLLQVIRNEPVSPRTLNPSIPKDLENICLKCLAKEPHKRYGTAQELADDLTRFLEGRPVLARPVGNVSKAVRWCRRNPIVAALLLLVAILLLSGTAVASFFAVQANNQLQITLAEKQRADDARTDAEDARQEAIDAQHDAEGARDEASQSTLIAQKNERLAKQNAALAEEQRKEAENARRLEAQQRQLAENERKHAQWQTYVARLQPMRQAWLEKEFGHLDRLLQESIPTEGEPDFRGWEWYYFQDQVNQASDLIGDHRKFLGSFAFDRVNNRILAAVAKDRWELWDLKTNQQIQTLHLDGCRPETVHFSPDGKYVAWGTSDCRLCVLQIGEHKLLHNIDAQPEENHPEIYMGDVAWSPTGDQIVSATRAGGIKVWNAITGDFVKQLQEPRGSARTGSNATLALSWHKDAGLAAGQRHGIVRVWEPDLSRSRWSKKYSSMWPSQVEWNPSGSRLLFAGEKTVVYSSDGELLDELDNVGGAARACWISDDVIAYGGSNQDVFFLDVLKRKHIEKVTISSTGIKSLAATSDKSILVGGRGGTIRQISTTANSAIAKKIEAHQGAIWGLDWEPNGTRIATGSRGGSVLRLWDAVSGNLDRELKGNAGRYINAVEWAPSGKQLLSLEPKALLFWDPTNGQLTRSIEFRDGHQSLSWSPISDAITIATIKSVNVLRPSTGQILLEDPLGEYGYFPRPSYSPEGKRIGIVSGSKIIIFDASTGTALLNEGLQASSVQVHGGAWSPDGRLFVTGGDRMQVFNAIEYKQIDELAGQRGELRHLQFDSAGHRIASVGGDNELIIWDAATGDMLLRLPVPGEKGLEKVDWSPDGRRIALTTSEGNLWIWGSPQMPEMPEETDFLEDGILKSVKTDEEQLAELSQRIEENHDDLALRLVRIEKLGKLQRWPEALAEVEKHLEGIPRDSWRPAQGLLLSLLLDEPDKAQDFANRCLELTSENNGLNAKSHAVLALAMAPNLVKDFGPLLEIAQEAAKNKAFWHHERSLLLALLRAKRLDDLGTILTPYLANESLPPVPKATTLLLESLRHHFGDKPDAAREFLRRAESIMNDSGWDQQPHQIENSAVALLLLREVRETLGVENDKGTVADNDFKLVDSWTVTVAIDDSKIDRIFAEFMKEEDKRFSGDSNQKPTPKDTPERRKNFDRMLKASKGVRGIMTLQENGEIRSTPSLGYPSMMPNGMTWREIEREEHQLIIEFRHKQGATSNLTLKVLGPDLLEVLPVKSESENVLAALMHEAMRTTWKRVKSDPGKDGLSVAKWLERIQDESETVRLEALATMPHFGPEAVAPFLQVAVSTRRPEVRQGIDMGLTKILSDPQGDVGEWIELLRHEQELVRQQAIRALPRFGEKAIPPLIATFDNKQPEFRHNVINVLGDIGSMRPSTIPAINSKLVEILKHDQDEHVRSVAARTMSMLRSKMKDSLPGNPGTPNDTSGRPAETTPKADELSDLIESLRSDKSKFVRIAAAQAIGESQLPSKATIEALGDALSADEDDLVRHWAADAIGKIGPAAKDALPALLKALKSDKSDTVRSQAAYAIRKIDAAPEKILPTLLVAAREDKGMYVRMSAVTTIGLLGPAAKDAAPDLVNSLRNDKFDSVRSNAAIALAKIGSQESIPAIIKAMNSDQNVFVREDAAKALGYFSPAAKEAIPALNNVVKSNESGRVKMHASLSLKKIRAALAAVSSSVKGADAIAFAAKRAAQEFGSVDDIRINRTWPIRYGLADTNNNRESGWRIKSGANLFVKHCIRCHGDYGGGNGPDAKDLSTPPRDFRQGVFKFHGGAVRDKPSRHAIGETLRLGLPGTAMPAFDQFDAEQTEAIVEFVRWLSMRGEFAHQIVKACNKFEAGDDEEERQDIADDVRNQFRAIWKKSGHQDREFLPTNDPPKMTDASVARGREHYQSVWYNCKACHDSDGRGDRFTKKVENGSQRPVEKITDLTAGKFKGGDGPVDLYLRLKNGIPGTAHPASLSAQKGDKGTPLWDIVHYVYHLAGKRPESATHVRRPPPEKLVDHPEDQLIQNAEQEAALKPFVPEGWGSIVGKVIYNGEPPPPRELRVISDKSVLEGKKLFDASLQVHPDSHALANVVVWFDREQSDRLMPIHESLAKPPVAPALLECRELSFQPHMLPLQVGQSLTIHNSNPVGENVRIEPNSNRNASLNQTLPADGKLHYQFRGAEREPIKITSAIHPWMQGYLLVKDHPYFAVTDKNGSFEIAGLPAGRWRIQFWHERSGRINEATTTGVIEAVGGQFFVTVASDRATTAELRFDPNLFKAGK